MTLDGASLLSVPLYARSTANAQHALAQLIARCGGCASADLATLLARPPRRVTVPDQPPFSLTADDVARTVEALLTDPTTAATIPAVLHEAVAGRYDRLAQDFVQQVGLDLDARWRLATVWTILCNEPWASYGAAPGTGFLAQANLDRAQFMRRVCRAVPKAPRGPDAPPRSGVPVLLLAGGADPRDPPANLRGRRAAFPNGRLVVVPHAGHGVISTGCVQAVVARFVDRGSARGLDASCVRDVRSPPVERP
jgi:pimeloyl-ACP methyl ester carboxylesterase